MHTIIHHDSTRLPLSHLSFVPGPTPGFSLTSYMTGVHRRREDSFLSASFARGEHFGCRLQLCFQARSDWRSAQLVLYLKKKLLLFFGYAGWHVGSQFPNQGSNLFPPPYPWHWKHGVLDTEVPGFIFSESGECDREMQFIHVFCVSYRVPWDSCREAEKDSLYDFS